MLDHYLGWISRYHKWIVLASVLLVLAVSYGATRLEFTNDFRIYFGKNNPQLAAFEKLEETFDKQDSVYFLVSPEQGSVFRREILTLIYDLTEEAWYLPYATRVNSLTNYQHTEARGDELTTNYLVRNPRELERADIERIRSVVLGEPTLVNNLVPADGAVTGIRVRVRLPDEDKKAANEVVYSARRLLDRYRLNYPNVRILLAGSTTAGVTLEEAVAQDISTLVFYSYMVIIGGLLLLLRSVRGALVTILLITFSTSATMGVYGWFSVVLSPVAGWVPSIVMTIAVADTVHILTSYFHGLRQGMDKQQAIRESMRINVNPVFITSLSTMIGVLCLNFSDSPPYQDLGNMVALGTLFAWCLTMTFLPAAITWLPIGKAHINRGPNEYIDRLSSWITRHYRVLIATTGVLFVVMASFIPRNELTERWHEYFDSTFPLRNTIEQINDKLSGVHYLHYVFNCAEDNCIHEPSFTRALEGFANWYRKQEGVAYVASLADISKRINRNMHGDDPAWYRLPDSRELAAQLFLLYEIGLPRELNLDDVVNQARSRTLLSVVVHKTDSEKLLTLDRNARHWLQRNAPGIQVSEGTGLDMVFAHINHRNITSLLKGTVLALILISFVLIFTLRSVRLGLISLIPNLVPAAITYGTWGLLVGRVDLSASVVICMSLGIVVDDTVHFLSKYLRARREKNLDTIQGLHYAFQTVGRALSITTFVLVSGFLVLTASHFSPSSVTGLLMAMTLSFALLADFFFLPPLLMVMDRRQYLIKA
jgi:predicted RND superfamily exporter protein